MPIGAFLYFAEEIRVRINPINCRDTVGLPKDLEWGRHTESLGKIDREETEVDMFADDGIRIRQKIEHTKKRIRRGVYLNGEGV